MEYDQFVHMVAPVKRINVEQKERLKAIWEKASDSIGCKVGETVEFEAKMMVEALKQITEAIKLTDDKIKENCLLFPEYSDLLTIPGFGPDVSSKVLGYIGNPFRWVYASYYVLFCT